MYGQKQKQDYLESCLYFLRQLLQAQGKWLQDVICSALISCFFKLLPKVIGMPDAHFLVRFKIQINTNNI